jgi:hypothetical protein
MLLMLMLHLGLQISFCSSLSWYVATNGRQSVNRCATKQPLGRNRNERFLFTTFLTPECCTDKLTKRNTLFPVNSFVVPSFSSISFQLLSSMDDISSDTDTSRTANESNLHDLSPAYKLGQYGFMLASVVILIIPDQTMTTLLATKLGGSAGFAIAAGLCHILRTANIQNRLRSDTYKRLNLGLFGFCLIGLSAIPGEAAFFTSLLATRIVAGMLTLLKLYGTGLAWNGWKRGVTTTATNTTTSKFSANEIFLELAQGVQSTIKGLKVESTKKALTYRNCLLLLFGGILSSFMEGLFNMRYQKEFSRTWFEITLQWSAMSRLFMIAAMVYTLKDAAERDRLTGTTFIELNLMVGAWAVLVGLGQAIYPLGFAAYRGVEMFAFAVPFLLKAYKSQREKQSSLKLKSKEN